VNIGNPASVSLTEVLPFITAVILSAHVSIGPIATEQTRDRSPESLIILTDTGERRDDLKVVARHPSPERHLSELTRGFSGRLLRLYPLVQRFAHPDRQPQPAYLLLSNCSRSRGRVPCNRRAWCWPPGRLPASCPCWSSGRLAETHL
jgi:hypothetical protein